MPQFDLRNDHRKYFDLVRALMGDYGTGGMPYRPDFSSAQNAVANEIPGAGMNTMLT